MICHAIRTILSTWVFLFWLGPGAASAQRAGGGPADVVVRQETYATAPTRHGDLALDVDVYDIPGRRPKGAVILIHGGSFTTGHRELPENRAYGEALARRGYVAAAISYRLLEDGPVVDGWAARYARMVSRHPHPRTAAAVQQLGPGFADAVAASAVDLEAAVGWLRERAGELGFDRSHIAVFGASAGTITALTTAYDMEAYGAEDLAVAAVIALRGRLLAEEDGSNPFEGTDPPLMILHDESDDRILLSEAEAVYRLARDGGTYVEFYTAEGYGHDLGGIDLLNLRVSEHESVLDRIDAFLEGAFSGELAQRSVRGRLLPARESESDVDPAAQRSGANLDVVRAALGDAVAALLQSVTDDHGSVSSLYGFRKADVLRHEFDDPGRRDWSYWPRERRGLALGHMNADQRRLTQAILGVFLSSKGYLQVNHIMMLEEFLANTETQGFLRGNEDYFVTIFGEPSLDGSWSIRFEGHHVSLNVTVGPDAIDVTPSFLGASPAPLPGGALAGFNPLRYEQRYAQDLLDSLDETQRAAAVLSDVPPADILTTQFQVDSTEWDDWQSRFAPDGVSAATFDANQLALFDRLMSEIVGVYRPEIGLDWLKTLDLRSLAFAWMGTGEPGQPHYYRIQGADFVFELDAAQENGAHIHTVWRDRGRDFGGDVLRDHYRRHSH